MTNVLVIGVGGVFGRHAAIALKSHGFNVTALMRDPRKLSDELDGIRVIEADGTDREKLEQACHDVDIVVYGVNPPNYDWRGKAVASLEPVAEIAEQKKLTIVFPGNVYGFDPSEQAEFGEKDEQHPRTEKGAIRKTMEERLKIAASRGAKVIILRMGDFIAPNAKSAWLPALISRGKKETTLRSPGPETLRRTWAYVPDAAEVIVKLLERTDELEDFNLFHFRGVRLSINEIAKTMEKAGNRKVIVKPFPWWQIKLTAPFSTLFQGLLEMRYLWNEEIHLSDAKLQAFLHGDVPTTDIRTVLLRSGLI